jgi:hypothetical protein
MITILSHESEENKVQAWIDNARAKSRAARTVGDIERATELARLIPIAEKHLAEHRLYKTIKRL